MRHVNIRFWQELSEYLANAPVYMIGEVMDSDSANVAEY